MVWGFLQAAMAAAMAERNGKGAKVPPPPKKINGVTMAVQLEEDAQVKNLSTQCHSDAVIL